MSRETKNSPSRRLWSRMFRPPADDPGERWAAELLRPLRGLEADCDIAPGVMTRIAADLRVAGASPRVSRLAWAASASLACASFVFLASTLVVLVMGGDEGAWQIADLAQSGWHVLQVFGRLLAELGARFLAPVLSILRIVRALVDVAAPLLRGAGILAAVGGALSILISTYVFASARKTAPRVNFQGGTR